MCINYKVPIKHLKKKNSEFKKFIIRMDNLKCNRFWETFIKAIIILRQIYI